MIDNDGSMATAASSQDNAASIAANDESDYGSDWDEAAVDAIVNKVDSQSAVEVIEKPAIFDDHGDDRPLLRLAKIRDNLAAAITGLDSASQELRPKGAEREVSIEIEYDEGNRRSFSRESASRTVCLVKLTR